MYSIVVFLSHELVLRSGLPILYRHIPALTDYPVVIGNSVDSLLLSNELQSSILLLSSGNIRTVSNLSARQPGST